MTRRTIVAQRYEQTITETVNLVGEAGGRSFEMSYCATNRRLKPDEEPTEADTVRWTVRAQFATPLGLAWLTGHHDVAPGGSHAAGIQRACVALLEACGANPVVIDMADTSDPREGDGGDR